MMHGASQEFEGDIAAAVGDAGGSEGSLAIAAASYGRGAGRCELTEAGNEKPRLAPRDETGPRFCRWEQAMKLAKSKRSDHLP